MNADRVDGVLWSTAKKVWAELRAEFPGLKRWEDLDDRARLAVRRAVECGQAAGRKS